MLFPVLVTIAGSLVNLYKLYSTHLSEQSMPPFHIKEERQRFTYLHLALKSLISGSEATVIKQTNCLSDRCESCDSCCTFWVPAFSCLTVLLSSKFNQRQDVCLTHFLFSRRERFDQNHDLTTEIEFQMSNRVLKYSFVTQIKSVFIGFGPNDISAKRF